MTKCLLSFDLLRFLVQYSAVPLLSTLHSQLSTFYLIPRLPTSKLHRASAFFLSGPSLSRGCRETSDATATQATRHFGGHFTHTLSAKNSANRQRWLCERLELRAAPSNSLGILFAPALAGALMDPPLPDDLTGQLETVLDRSVTDADRSSTTLPAIPRRGSHYRPDDPVDRSSQPPFVVPAFMQAQSAPVVPFVVPAFMRAQSAINPLPAPLPGIPDFVGHVGGPGVGISPSRFTGGGGVLASGAIDTRGFGGGVFARSFGAVGAGDNTAGGSFFADTQSSLAGSDGGLARADAALRSNTLDTDDGTSGGATDGAIEGAVGANSGPNVHVDWQRLAVKHAQREGKLILTKDGEPNMAMAFEELSAWFIKRLNDRGFGELRDQLVADFPEEKPQDEPSTGIVEGTGHGALTSAGGCGGGSSGVHLWACDDEYSTRWNAPDVSPIRTVNGNVLTNDHDTDWTHTLSSYWSSYPQHGDLVLNPDGTMQYISDDGYIGADMFFYYILDGYGYNDVAAVTIYVYEPDVDVDSNNDGSLDPDNSYFGTDDPIEFNGSLPGKILAVNDDDDNGNGVPDNHANEVTPFVDNLGQPMADDDLMSVTLAIPFENGFLKDRWVELEFSSPSLKLWDSQQKNNEIVFVNQPNPPLPSGDEDPYDNWWKLGTEPVPQVLWLEGMSTLPLGGLLQFILDPTAPTAEDDAFVTVIDVDLDIDSDNNQIIGALPEGSDWEETLEDHPYGLGKLIMLDVPATRPVTPVLLRLAPGLNPNDPTITVKFDWDPAGSAGWVNLWDTALLESLRNPLAVDEGGNRVFPGFEYSLSDLNYNAQLGDILVYAEGTQENQARRTLAGVEQFGKPDERIRATVVVNGNDLDTDEVKYLVANEDSFFYFLQNNQGLRAALGSRAIYTRADMQAFSMQILDNQELTSLGVPQPIADFLGNRGRKRRVRLQSSVSFRQACNSMRACWHGGGFGGMGSDFFELAVAVRLGRFQPVAEIAERIMKSTTIHGVDPDAEVSNQPFQVKEIDRDRLDVATRCTHSRLVHSDSPTR